MMRLVTWLDCLGGSVSEGREWVWWWVWGIEGWGVGECGVCDGDVSGVVVKVGPHQRVWLGRSGRIESHDRSARSSQSGGRCGRMQVAA